MAKYLLDENLSWRIVDKLLSEYNNLMHVTQVGLSNKYDHDIWQVALANELTIITKDNDFLDMSHLYGCPPKVIKLRCGNRSTDFIVNILRTNKVRIEQFSRSENCYLEII